MQELALSAKEKEATEAMDVAKQATKEIDRLVAKDRNGKQKPPETGKTVYMSLSRKLDRFTGQSTSGKKKQPAEEWIEDAQAIIASRSLKTEEQVAFIIENIGVIIKKEPQKIFAILAKVFGDGDNLYRLQQRFFSYKQHDGDDLVTCSLELVKIYDRLVGLDASFKGGRETQLKNRLAEAVTDKHLQMELRRLNTDHPKLSFFDARDRVMLLMQ